MSQAPAPTPRRVEWSGPENWTIWADEDGVHVKSRSGDCLEQCDVERLFSLWSHARAAKDASHIPAPAPPDREQRLADGWAWSEKQAKRRAHKAIEAEFTDPF